MTDNKDKVDQLSEKLGLLFRKHNEFLREINDLKFEISRLKNSERKAERPVADIYVDLNKEEPFTNNKVVQEPVVNKTTKPTGQPVTKPKSKIELEKLIGENLINKIGIAITIIGVAIGAKYSIENELISPLTRIILGYLTGIGLLGFGIKLKKNYENYSAVLVGGAIAIMYFITYFAYSFYGLIPQILAFVLMVVFTAFSIVAAINYNKQVIAHIGLVGAYAVPFLLSEGSGQVAILFTYMTIINIGILVIAFKRCWKQLYYSSFVLSWLIFSSWYVASYQMEQHLLVSLIFLTLFFVIFYLIFLAYKLLEKEKFVKSDVMLLLANSFLFYGLGYVILSSHEIGVQLLGLFTLCNAIIHFIVSVIVYRQKLIEKKLLYLISGLVLCFITITVPVQLEGSWVTLLWVAEATLLFWLGKRKNIPVYEKLAFPLMILAFFSLIQDWNVVDNNYTYDYLKSYYKPFFNVNFLSSLLFVAAFGFINILNYKQQTSIWKSKMLSNFFSVFIPGVLIFTLYYIFRMEISYYWEQRYAIYYLEFSLDGLDFNSTKRFDLVRFKSIWLINYSLFFVSILSLANYIKIKHERLGGISIILTLFALIIFLFKGLYILGQLRDSYLSQTVTAYDSIGVFNIGVRYISFLFVALALFVFYKCLRQSFIKLDFRKTYDCILHVTILWIASSELINWMDIAESEQSYKLGLSILWGVYSLLLIVLGIWKKRQYLRIAAIVLFGVTLAKLFLYDISHLDTISKTIVFVSLGVLMLIISFLYNKYKYMISDDTEI